MSHGPDTHIALQKIQEWMDQGDENETLKFENLRLTSLPPLPPNVKNLSLLQLPINSIESLPPNLEHLLLAILDIKELPELPNTLKSLSCDYIYHLEKLPIFPQD